LRGKQRCVYSHVPKSSEELLWTIRVHFEKDFQHKDTEEEPVGVVDVEADKPSIQEDHEVEENPKEPTHWRIMKFVNVKNVSK